MTGQSFRTDTAKEAQASSELRKLLGTLTEALMGKPQAEVDSSPSPP